MEMKIGILTFHHGYNYGGFMQTYSLFCYLQQQYSKVSIINYINPRHFLKKNAMMFLNRNPISTITNIRKAMIFHSAHKKYNMTPLAFTPSGFSRENFDVVILGSDEIWNFQNPMFGFDPTYFGYRVKAKKIISYAASFGAQPHTKKLPETAIECLRKLNYISVRDKNTQKGLSRTIGQAPEILIDPVFLYEHQILTKYPKLNKYILIYSPKLDKDKIEEIIRLAKAKNKKLVALTYPKSWCDINVNFPDMGEWLGYFKNADIVITSMFHGAMFCIKYNKQFSFVLNDYRKFKIDYLFDFLTLNNRVYPQAGFFEQIFSNVIDYHCINHKISSMVTESKSYLQKSIND